MGYQRWIQPLRYCKPGHRQNENFPGTRTFAARLFDNAMAAAFRARLPITVNMVELNESGKYVGLSHRLPANAFIPVTIQMGNFMLYGSSAMVLFCKILSTCQSYTRPGRIDGLKGLASAIGSGNVTVAFELQ